ncbi:MAG: hypothetical protein ACXVCP_18210 [Bdellovibrio sp.]
MKIATLIAAFLLSTNFAFAQSAKEVLTLENLKKQTENSDELATPTILQLSSVSFEKISGQQLLAPQHGTEFAFSVNQSHLMLSQENANMKGSGTTDYSMGSLTIAHALNSHLFFNAKLGYGLSNGKSDYTAKVSNTLDTSKSNADGIIDPVVTIGGRINSGSVSSILSLGASLKTESYESEYSQYRNFGESKSNLKNGGYAYIPSVTIFSNSKSENLFGLSASYILQQERVEYSRESNGSTNKWTMTNGNIQNISVFAETPENNVSFGGALTYTKHESTTSKNNNYNYKSEGRALAYTSATAFAKIILAKNMVLVPSATIGRFGEGASELDTKDIYSVGFTGKTTF